MTTREGPLSSRVARDIQPPPHLQRRIVQSLRTRGLLAPRRSPAVRAPALAAAALVLIAAGYVLGSARQHTGSVASEAPAFMLLLYEDQQFEVPAASDSLVDEYRAWAAAARRRGITITGEKLDDAEFIVADGVATAGDAASGLGQLSGFFMIAAGSEAEAVEIARTCPHLQYGGRIVVRRIVPT